MPAATQTLYSQRSSETKEKKFGTFHSAACSQTTLRPFIPASERYEELPIHKMVASFLLASAVPGWPLSARHGSTTENEGAVAPSIISSHLELAATHAIFVFFIAKQWGLCSFPQPWARLQAAIKAQPASSVQSISIPSCLTKQTLCTNESEPV